jgi:drug/metabolite transporter (DMT)-like permease
MPFIGEFAALGTSLCFSFGSTMFTLAGRAFGSILANRVRLLVAVLITMLLHLLTYGQLLPLNAGNERWFWLGLSGFVGLVVGDAFLFQSFVMVGPRLAMLMMSLAPVLGTILAWLFLSETLTPKELLGILVTVGGIMVVVTQRRNNSNSEPGDQRQYIIGLLCGLGGAAGQASGLVLSKMGLTEDFPALSANVIRLLVATIVIWVVATANRQLFSSFQTVRAHPRAFLFLCGGTILGPVIGVWLSLIAVQNTSVGVASTLSSLMPIFLIPITYVLFKERITMQAVIGTLISFAGMVVLFL